MRSLHEPPSLETQYARIALCGICALCLVGGLAAVSLFVSA